MSSVEEKASRRRCRLLPNCAHIDHSQTHLHSCRALQCGRGIILLLWLFLFFLLQKIPLNRFSFSWLRSILAYWLTSATMGDRHEVWQNLLMSLLLVYLLAYLVDFSILKKMCDNISVWSLRLDSSFSLRVSLSKNFSGLLLFMGRVYTVHPEH